MESPCIRMCTLNEDNVCLGCGRLLNEITAWASYSHKQRAKSMKRCVVRIQALDALSPLLAQARKNQIKNS